MIALAPLACSGPVLVGEFIEQGPTVDGGASDAGDDGNTDAGGGEVDAGAECGDRCLARGGLGWEKEPYLVWIGASELDAPSCPKGAGEWKGNADLMASNVCPVCSCGDPSCVFPSGVTASTSPTCPNNAPPGATLTPFDAPAGWDGSCVAAPSPIPSNLLASIAVEPPTITPCTPKVIDPIPKAKGGPVSWGTFARACQLGLSLCTGEDSVCAPPAPEGFRYCIAKALAPGEVEPSCSAPYGEKFVFYTGIDPNTDTRDCTPCQCEPPAGAQCSAYLTAYSDPSCAMPLDSSTVALAGGACSTITPGMTLSGMAVQWVTNEPGSCTPSGGEPIGTVEPAGPSVFCCESATQ